VSELSAYQAVRPEVRYSTGSRIDFLLSEPGLPDTYVEVKNVHLKRRARLAEFPDCVTERGAKHLGDLSKMIAEGHRAVMLYLVQRTDCDCMQLARDLDPGYGSAFDKARSAGVEILCYDTRISREGITLGASLPVLEPM
jgi:sugar fermentation stimulation protein A